MTRSTSSSTKTTSWRLSPSAGVWLPAAGGVPDTGSCAAPVRPSAARGFVLLVPGHPARTRRVPGGQLDGPVLNSSALNASSDRADRALSKVRLADLNPPIVLAGMAGDLSLRLVSDSAHRPATRRHRGIVKETEGGPLRNASGARIQVNGAAGDAKPGPPPSAQLPVEARRAEAAVQRPGSEHWVGWRSGRTRRAAQL